MHKEDMHRFHLLNNKEYIARENFILCELNINKTEN